jgi:hypothetical protein
MARPWKATLNRFPVTHVCDFVFNSWNIHHIVLRSLPVLDGGITWFAINIPWYRTHLKLTTSDREHAIASSKECNQNPDNFDALASVKSQLCTYFTFFATFRSGTAILLDIHHFGRDGEDQIRLIISSLRLDVTSYTVVADAFFLPMIESASNPRLDDTVLDHIPNPHRVTVNLTYNQLRTWKQLLPAFVERCRQWSHQETCEYITAQQVPVSYESREPIICNCGRGRDVEEFLKLGGWASTLAPYVTRAAISSIFAVPHLESVLGEDVSLERIEGLNFGPLWSERSDLPIFEVAASKVATASHASHDEASEETLCSKCHKPGMPKLLFCSRCHKVKYCSKDCQKADWKAHKHACAQA